MNDIGYKTCEVQEKTIRQLADMLEKGETTSVELVEAYMMRIGYYDRTGLKLNSVTRLNPKAFAEAEASDKRRRNGKSKGLLDGIPFVAKDSYSVKGMPVSAGSPAFKDLIARQDAFAVEALKSEGAVFLGLTNMPPMADGGMQRGLYGRAESPYNKYCLTAAWESGSSNGSGTAVASSFAGFGLGEETWSSGRTPASNNSLCAWTPSRRLVSVRGNWPLVPTMDVCVPFARTLDDLKVIALALLKKDEDRSGDFWREQTVVSIPDRIDEVRSELESDNNVKEPINLCAVLMYSGFPQNHTDDVPTRPSISSLFEGLLDKLQEDGVSVSRTEDFPVAEKYQGDGHIMGGLSTDPRMPAEFLDHERKQLMSYGWDRFLQVNRDTKLNRLSDVDGNLIFPDSPDQVDFSDTTDMTIPGYVAIARQQKLSLDAIPHLQDGLNALERIRKEDFENWLTEGGYDAIVLPTVSDVGPYDADYNPTSNLAAMRNGTWVANGNLIFRHLGIPTVTIPLGLMTDIGMPVGLTIAGPAWSDAKLFAIASRITQTIRTLGEPYGRHRPTRLINAAGVDAFTLPTDPVAGIGDSNPEMVSVEATMSATSPQGLIQISVQGKIDKPASPEWILRVAVNGQYATTKWTSTTTFHSEINIKADDFYWFHSFWQGPYSPTVTTVLKKNTGESIGTFLRIGTVG